MNPSDSNSQQSRANEVWRRLVGLFGGDAVERKFGRAPPPEWVSVIAKLGQVELDRGMRRLVHSGRDAIPSLPAFVKLCRTIADDNIEEGPRAIALPNPNSFTGDKWDIASNQRLLSHIMRRTLVRTAHYGARGSSHMASYMEVLVRYKKSWASLMRDWDIDRDTGEIIEPSMDDQDTSWKHAMESAEEEITLKRAA